MSFASAGYFFLAALLPLIVLMYLLKLRRVERPVSSTYLWRQMVRDVEANAPWQRLRRSLLLFLQLLFLALLIFTLARPQTSAPGLAADTAIFIFDTSASMAATDVTPTRLEAAKTRARQLLDTLPAEARVTVIDAGRDARILASESADRRQVLQAIESMRPGTGGSDLGVALQLASAIARRRPGCHTIVLSDGNANLPQRLAIQGRLTYEPIGLEDDNQAVALLNLQPGPPAADGAPTLTAFSQVVNYGDRPAQRRLAISADGLLVNVFDLALPAGGEQPVLVEGLPARAAMVEARLLPHGSEAAPAENGGLDGDFLALDDLALEVNRPAEPVSVTLVSPGNRFLETGLSLLPGLRLTRVNPGSGALPAAALTIFDGVVPLTATLPAGALLYLGPLRSTELFSVTGVLAMPPLRPASASEPLLANVALDDVHVLDAARIPLPPWARPVIVSDDLAGGAALPLLFAGEIGGRRAAVLAFDLRRSDLPLTIAFPLLLANLVDWLAPGGGGLPRQVAPGDVVTLESTLGASPGLASVIHPDGRRAVFDLSSGPAVFADTFDLGLYTVQYSGQSLQFAVNLFNPQESRLQPVDNLPVAGIEAASAAGSDTAQKDWWRWLAAMALVVLTAEWLVYHRASVRMLADYAARRLRVS